MLVYESLLYLWLIKNGGIKQTKRNSLGRFSGENSPGRDLSAVN